MTTHTPRRTTAYFAAGASVLLLLSLYNTIRYELQALNGSLSLTWRTRASETGEQRRTTTVVGTQRTIATNPTMFHLSHANNTNSTLLLLQQQHRQQEHRAFPRWGDEGIDIATILDFIFHSSQHAVPPQQRRRRKKNDDDATLPRYTPTTDHANDVGYWFPEVLYVLDTDGLWCSRRHRDILIDFGQQTVRQKLEPVEALLSAAVTKHLRWLDDNNPHNDDAATAAPQWSRLARALAHGIPFLAYYGDFTGCNRFNYNNASSLAIPSSSSTASSSVSSIPLFTTAAAVSCDYAIPFPNYQTIHDASTLSNQSFALWKERYPVASKIRKVVWRGSLTGNVLNDTHKSQRWTMLETYHNHSSGWFDVGATRLPKRHESQQLDLSSVGGIVTGMAMEDFQRYQVILDMDGNSWSSRFGKLLCYNSVVLKMKPDHVDYFFYDLIPWVHYIPVNDMDDLLEKARFALDPRQASLVAEITVNANAWCQRRMVRDQIAEDMLHILERYVEMIDAGSSAPDWQQADMWTKARAQIQQPDHPLAMELLWPTTPTIGTVIV
jgi:hypothetical protein